MADYIRVSTQWLERCSKELTDTGRAVRDVYNLLNAIRLDKGEGGELKVSSEFRLTLTGAAYSGSNAADDIAQLTRAASALSAALQESGSAAARAARHFEDVEGEILNIVNGADIGKQTDIYLTKALAQVLAYRHGAWWDALPEDPLQEKRDNWGKDANTVSDAEFAYLALCTNNAASGKNMKQDFLDSLKKLPEGHPLRDIDPGQVSTVSYMGVEAVVIRTSNDSAIVMFAGTDSALDVIADTGIAVNGKNVVTSAQLFVANSIIKRLEASGCNNIQVSGHSLGGYLAADVTMRNKSVTQCVTFDAPGASSQDVASNKRARNKQSQRIHNYTVNGSVVNLPGVHYGDTESINVNPNWAGPLPNHRIANIFNDHFGGMDTINKEWQA